MNYMRSPGKRCLPNGFDSIIKEAVVIEHDFVGSGPGKRTVPFDRVAIKS
jgi:hypothetical protein